MKKPLALIVVLALVMALTVGCAANPPKTTAAPTAAPTVVPAKSAVPMETPGVSPHASALPDTVEPVEPGVSPGVNPNASPGVNDNLVPEVSPGANPSVSPGTSPGASPSISPGTSPATGAASPTHTIKPTKTGASIPEAPSFDLEAMTNASEIAAAAVQQTNVQSATAIQFEHTCIVGLTLRSGKKYNQAIEDAVLAAVRKKNDALAYFITADKNDVNTLKQIQNSWNKAGKQEENISKFTKIAESLKDAAEIKSKQS